MKLLCAKRVRVRGFPRFIEQIHFDDTELDVVMIDGPTTLTRLAGVDTYKWKSE